MYPLVKPPCNHWSRHQDISPKGYTAIVTMVTYSDQRLHCILSNLYIAYCPIVKYGILTNGYMSIPICHWSLKLLPPCLFNAAHCPVSLLLANNYNGLLLANNGLLLANNGLLFQITDIYINSVIYRGGFNLHSMPVSMVMIALLIKATYIINP